MPLLLLLSLSFLHAATPQNAPTLDEIKASFLATDAKIQSVIVDWDGFVGSRDPSVPIDKNSPNSTVHMIRQGEKFRWEKKDYKDGKISYEAVQAFDGRATNWYQPMNGEGTIDNSTGTDGRVIPSTAGPLPSRVPVFVKELAVRIESDPLELSEGTKEIDGAPCFVVEGHAADVKSPQLVYQLYLDPILGYVPRLIESSTIQDGTEVVKYTVHFVDYEQKAPGLWFPQCVEESSQIVASGKTSRYCIYVKNLQLNVPVDEALFSITFPPGTKVSIQTPPTRLQKASFWLRGVQYLLRPSWQTILLVAFIVGGLVSSIIVLRLMGKRKES